MSRERPQDQALAAVEARRQAIAALAEEASADRVERLMAALGDEEWRLRKEAVSVIKQLSPSSDLLTVLLDALAPGDNVGLRNAAVEAIGHFGEVAAVGLLERLPSLDADGRKLAAEALAVAGGARALDGLAALLGDADPNVRGAAVEAVGGAAVGSYPRAVALLEGSLRDPEPFVRFAALDGLNRLEVVLPLATLEPLLAARALTPAALIAVGRTGEPRAAALLVAALSRARGSGWVTAATALSQLAASGERARSAVRRALEGCSAADRKKLLHLAMEAPPLGSHAEEADPGRRAALLLSGVLGGREAARAALSGLEHDTLAGEAEQALLWIGAEAVEPLVEQLSLGAERARPAALGVLGRLLHGSPTHPAVEHLVSALSASEPQVARAALLALSEVGDARCLGACERWLTLSAPPGLRKAAEQALSLVAGNFRKETLELARAAASRETGALLFASVITLLGGPVLGDLDQDLEYLARELNSESAVVRRAVAEALGSVQSARSVDIVVFALTDEEPEVQLAAVRALGRARAPEGQPLGVERLLELIERSPDEVLVAAALPALGETQDHRAAAALRPLARSASALVAVSAVEALGALALGARASHALSGLIEALGHPEPEVVKAAASALSEQPGPRVVTHLGACLDHEAWDVRRLAADLLGRRGGPGTMELLTARHALEPDRSVREAVARALTRLASGRFTTSPPPHPGQE